MREGVTAMGKTTKPYSAPTALLISLDKNDVLCASVSFGENPIDLPKLDF